jgi:hypothetical protein
MACIGIILAANLVVLQQQQLVVVGPWVIAL